MKKNNLLMLVFIFILACVLRFFMLGEVPLGFHRDEAFLGYNAFSILKTGMDMSGNFLPLHLESFLFSPAGYSYFSIPFIAIFDLSAFSVRFASAFFGSLTVLISFLLVTELFYTRKEKYLIGITAAFFIAISPWNIILSRVTTDNVIVVFFISLATYLFLLSIRKNNRRIFFLSMIFYSLTLFIYQAPRYFLVLFIPLLFFTFFKKQKIKYHLFYILSFLLLIVLPVFLVLSSPTLSVRLRTLSVFYSDNTRAYLSQSFVNDAKANVPLLETRIFHNKITGYSMQIAKNYFDHLSFNFMFTEAYFPDRYRVPYSSLLYLFDLPLILIGIWSVIRKKEKAGIILLGWILLVPVGASLAFDDIPNMQRTLIFFPAISIISAVGFIEVYKRFKYKKTFLLISTVIIGFALISFLHQYFVDARFYRLWYRQEGYKELVEKVNNLVPKYKYAVITKRESAPTVFFLFYTRFNPIVFQKETALLDKTQTDSVAFGKYIFDNSECPVELAQKTGKDKEVIGDSNVLYVDSGYCKIQNGINYLSEIKRADGSTAFRIAELKERSD